jgi:hypothetical protein
MPIRAPEGYLDITNATLRASEIVTTSNVGIANANPTNTLSIGSNVFFEDTSSNAMTVRGNVVAEGIKLGFLQLLPSYDLELTANVGNSISNTVQFTNSTTGFVTSSNVGIGTNAPDGLVDVGTVLKVKFGNLGATAADIIDGYNTVDITESGGTYTYTRDTAANYGNFLPSTALYSPITGRRYRVRLTARSDFTGSIRLENPANGTIVASYDLTTTFTEYEWEFTSIATTMYFRATLTTGTTMQFNAFSMEVLEATANTDIMMGGTRFIKAHDASKNFVAIGPSAGLTSQDSYSVAVGYQAGAFNQGNQSVAVGENAGETSQGGAAVAIGSLAARYNQGVNTVAVGRSAARYSQGTDAVAVGYIAGSNNQGSAAVAVGREAGRTSQGVSAVAVGHLAGSNNQGVNSVAVGHTTGETSQGNYTTAMGLSAGRYNQAESAVAVGNNAGNTSQGAYAVAMGYVAGLTSQGASATAVGNTAGQTSQGNQATAVGTETGRSNQGLQSTAVGHAAGNTSQGTYATAVGSLSGFTAQGGSAVAMGRSAGQTSQGAYAVAVGQNAGLTEQGTQAVAVGGNAGSNDQGGNAVAVGINAGRYNQGGNASAVGINAGQTSQGIRCVAMGNAAGQISQGEYAIALGEKAGQYNQPANTFYVSTSSVRGGNIAASALAYTSAGEIVEETGVNFDSSGTLIATLAQIAGCTFKNHGDGGNANNWKSTGISLTGGNFGGVIFLILTMNYSNGDATGCELLMIRKPYSSPDTYFTNATHKTQIAKLGGHSAFEVRSNSGILEYRTVTNGNVLGVSITLG